MVICRKIKKKITFCPNSKLTEYEGYLEEGGEGEPIQGPAEKKM